MVHAGITPSSSSGKRRTKSVVVGGSSGGSGGSFKSPTKDGSISMLSPSGIVGGVSVGGGVGGGVGGSMITNPLVEEDSINQMLLGGNSIVFNESTSTTTLSPNAVSGGNKIFTLPPSIYSATPTRGASKPLSTAHQLAITMSINGAIPQGVFINEAQVMKASSVPSR